MVNEEINLDYFQALENENKQLKGKATELAGHIASSSFAGEDHANIVQYQLSTDDVLDKIEHFLKGDIVMVGASGEIDYKEQTNKELVIMNEFGINAIMGILSNYIHRGHSLSFYDEERINEIMGDLGDKLAQYIFCNYEKMGMDTIFKRSRYHLVVINILHLVESTYRKAIMGKQQEEINRHTLLTQSENVGMMKPTVMPKKRFNPFNPKSWF